MCHLFKCRNGLHKEKVKDTNILFINLHLHAQISYFFEKQKGQLRSWMFPVHHMRIEVSRGACKILTTQFYHTTPKKRDNFSYNISQVILGKNRTSSNIKWQECLSKHLRPFIPKGNIIVLIDFTLIYFNHLDKRNFVRKSKGKNFKCYLLTQRRVYY